MKNVKGQKDSLLETQERANKNGESFKSLGDFVQTLRFSPDDSRFVEHRIQSTGTGSDGGVLVPTRFLEEVLIADQQNAVIRPRAKVIPPDDRHPDAAITIPALNQVGFGMLAGMQVGWVAEGEEKPESEVEFTDVSLEPKEGAGHIVVTDKLLRNSSAASMVLSTLFGMAKAETEDRAFLTGDGVGKPLGLLNSAATIKVNRASASQIAYVDLVKMIGKARKSKNLVWLASPTIAEELLTLEDDNGNLIWQPSGRDGVPGYLLGYPLEWSERSPLLGAYGDLVLVDLSYYLIQDGSPLMISTSRHVHFFENKTVIKAFWLVDGQPWINGPLTLEGGYEASPFVALN